MLSLLLACNQEIFTEAKDADGDGFTAEAGDCDDGNAAAAPDQPEYCDAVDNDCNGQVDDGLNQDWYLDKDGDGVGSGEVISTCEPSENMVQSTGDCDDQDASRFPGAMERCDGIDNDCNNVLDEAETWYPDGDGDGVGVEEGAMQGCFGEGWARVAGDCDDENAMISPLQPELCDELDNDCDGSVDEEVAAPTEWYQDSDGDGYGAGTPVSGCIGPEGWVAVAGDCDDTDASLNPGADWFFDEDGDGFGATTSVVYGCEQPEGSVGEGGDCEDSNPTISPAAIEICDNLDNDCDALIDDADSSVDRSTGTVFYEDSDGDGFGYANSAVLSCAIVEGLVSDGSDCNDQDSTIFPGAIEVCDGIDNDCSGNADSDAVDQIGSAPDSDGDGFGQEAATYMGCDVPNGLTDILGDCDDANRLIFPGAREYCDGVDDDCSGIVDDNAVDALLWYADLDQDGQGDPANTAYECEQPVGYTDTDSDCDDTDAEVFVGATEYCDGEDDDCDGSIDNNAVDVANWYEDLDGDGYGAVTLAIACSGPAGSVLLGGDCDEQDAAIHPGMEELCNNGVDEDCDGEVDEGDAVDALVWYEDQDGDGFGTIAISACTQPDGYTSVAGDCEDGDSTVFPGAVEGWYDSIDSDCDGVLEPSVCDSLPDIAATTSDESCVSGGGSAWSLQTRYSVTSSMVANASYTHIASQPLVVSLTDDNASGSLDAFDTPDLIYLAGPGISSSSAACVVAIELDSAVELWSYCSTSSNQNIPAATSGLAAGDLEGDGTVEVAVTTKTGDLVLISVDPSNPTIPSILVIATGFGSAVLSPPVFANVDGGSEAQILLKNKIFNADGSLYRTLPSTCTYPVVVDLDEDGAADILCGGEAYTAGGATLWSSGTTGGRPAFGNFDGDDAAELVHIITSSGSAMVYLYDDLGSGAGLLWSQQVSTSTATFPVVADLDGDGSDDLAVPITNGLVALDASGSLFWSELTLSGINGFASAFDFNLDGADELIYGDAAGLYIFDVANNARLFEEPDYDGSGTNVLLGPVVADVDGNGNADIVVGATGNSGGWDGLYVLEETTDSWGSAQGYWNQTFFSPLWLTDAMTIPQSPELPWTTQTGFRRAQAQSEVLGGTANLSVNILGVCEDCSGGGVVLGYTVENTGAVRAGPETSIALYSVSGGARTLLQTTILGEPILPGEIFEGLSFQVADAEVGTEGLVVVVDDDGTGLGQVVECDESDNEGVWDSGVCH